MAQVTGDIGGQPVALNNAATEETLKQLLAAMVSMARSQAGAGGKSFQKEYEKELRKLAAATKKQSAIQESNNKLREKENQELAKNKALLEKQKKEQEKYIKSLQDTVSTLNTASDMIRTAAGSITTLASNISNMGNSMSSAAAAMSQIPIVGGMVASVFGAVANAAEKSYKAFQQSASVGANFGGSISQMIDSATGAGLTLETFTGLIAKNADNLRYLGGTTSDGARRLAELGKQIRSKDFKNVNDDLARLGYTTEGINEGLGQYSMLMAKSGKLQGMSNKELISGTAEYLRNLDAVSKLTGKSKDALQAEEKARQSDAQFRVLQAKVGKDGATNLNLLMNSMGPEMQKAFQAYAATGTAFNDQAKALMVTNPRAARAMERFHQQMKQSGTVTAEMMHDLDKELRSSSDAASKSASTTQLATFASEKYGGIIVDQMNLASQNMTLEQAQAKQAKDLVEQRAKAERLVAEGMDPANMKRFQENIAELSNRFTKLIGENMPKFISVFESLTRLVEGPAMTAFTFLIDNIGKVIAGFVALKLAAELFALKLKIEQHKAAQRGSSAADPMYVVDVGGGGGGGGGGKGKKGPKGKGKGIPIKSLARGAGVAGAVMGAVSLAGDISDISEEEKRGEISKEKATEKKSGAVGGALGGAGGAWGGAAAGAAIGSVVPIVGTAIGGVIGGAIGYWAGNTLGKAVGEGVGKGVNKLTTSTDKNTNATKESSTATKENTKATTDAAKGEAKAPTKASAPDWMDPISVLKWSKAKTESTAVGASSVSGANVPVNAGDMQKGLIGQLKNQGINDPKAISNILAQVQAESGFTPRSENLKYSGKKLFELYGAGNKGGNKARFKTLEEAEALAAKGPEAVGNMIYGGRMGNAADEGFKYRGRGLIQLTGKENYKKFGDMIGVDLVKNPDLANDPNIAQKIAAAYFAEKQKKGTNLADINAVGKAVGYAGGAAETAKRTQLAAAMQSQLGSATPDASTVSTQVASATQAAGATTGTLKTLPTTTTTGTTPAGTQESVQSLLASLNNKMDQLIRLNQNIGRLNERQLTVQKGLTNNLFVGV